MAVETTVGASGTERDVSNAVIDSDGHVQEQLTLPPDIMTEVMERIGGTDMEALTAMMASPENDPFPMESSGPPTLQTIAGGWDPLARLVDMDADGIDVAVLYPTTPGLAWVPDADVLHTMAHEYNRWLHEYCSARPDAPRSASGSCRCRIPALAVKEMERCVRSSASRR